MTFGEAFRLLQEGRRVRRRAWGDHKLWLVGVFCTVQEENKRIAAIDMHIQIAGEPLEPWTITKLDSFSEDWEEVVGRLYNSYCGA